MLRRLHPAFDAVAGQDSHGGYHPQKCRQRIEISLVLRNLMAAARRADFGPRPCITFQDPWNSPLLRPEEEFMLLRVPCASKRLSAVVLALAWLGLPGCEKDSTQAKLKVIVSTNAPSAPHAAAHTNRLAREKSPYLLQHQHNPVDWYAWGEEAFARARRENKPIFLSIGYSTCHWCHVMERETFEDKKVADFLNQHFVSIKVDREERPDVDKIYMSAVQAMTQQGGWPLNSFLTPDLKPFYGGTYFPPEAKYGRPSFLQVIQHI